MLKQVENTNFSTQDEILHATLQLLEFEAGLPPYEKIRYQQLVREYAIDFRNRFKLAEDFDVEKLSFRLKWRNPSLFFYFVFHLFE